MATLAGDHTQVLVGGYDLTGDHNKVSVDDSRVLHDQTAFGDAVHNFLHGQRNMVLTHGGYLNAAAGRSHPVLKANGLEGIVSVLVGQNADPAVGDPVYSLSTRQYQYSSAPEVNGVIPFGATFGNQGLAGGWGEALAPPVSFTNSTNGSAVDNGAASSSGGAAFLHILGAAASDTYTITVEESATGSFSGEESTLATFTLDASAVGAERIAIATSIARYSRFKAVRSGSAGDTVQIAVSLIRF
jgi:hypothetical protein